MISPQDKKIAVGVSGGADSMCLLDIMVRMAITKDLLIAVFHYNHKYRGKESDNDEKFVADYCFCREIPCLIGRPESPLELNENAAREARYSFFETQTDYCKTVAVAHTADDNAETMLMRLARGSGSKGFSGINPVMQRGELKIIRPIIEFARDEVMSYLEYNKIPHIEDKSNCDLRFTRNQIRSQVIPVMKNINPQLSSHALSLSEDIRTDNDYILSKAYEFLTEEQFTSDNPRLNKARFRDLHRAVASRVIMVAASQFNTGIYREHVDEILQLVLKNKGGWTVELPKGLKLKCIKNTLIFTHS